jgi:hypothetical protein
MIVCRKAALGRVRLDISCPRRQGIGAALPFSNGRKTKVPAETRMCVDKHLY